jgi:hypothetical protein
VIDSQDMTRKFGALDNSVTGSHTQEEWSELIRLWKWRCFYCARPICQNSLDPKAEITKDHMDPISRGGTDFIWNIVPACFACNCLKGDMTVDEFRATKPAVSGKPSEFYTGDSGLAPTGKPEEARKTTDVCKTIGEILEQAIPHLNRKRTMDLERHPEYWQNRRMALKAQAASIGRRRLETAGQLTLPIFGDGAERLPIQSEAAALVVKKGIALA